MRTARLVGALLVGWVGAWLGLGLLQGDPTLLLRAGAAPRPVQLAYLILLYAWLLLATRWCWRRWGPRVPDLRWPGGVWTGLGVGVGALAVHRAVLWGLGLYHPDPVPLGTLAIACLTSPLLALGEEVVFRGYLFGTVREDFGRLPAYLGVNLLFAVLHVLRPGTLDYKVALAFGLLLVGVVLSRWAERSGSLWPSIGLHSALIVGNVLDSHSRVDPGWLAGLKGDPAAGLVGWTLLLGLLALAPKGPRHHD